MKLVKYDVMFKEIPDEISLGLYFSKCPIRCKDCNQPELWKDEGYEFTFEHFKVLLEMKYKNVSCILLMGGEASLGELSFLIRKIKNTFPKLKIAWYTGLEFSDIKDLDFLHNLNYIKVGPYIKEFGGLESRTTNQRLYKVTREIYNIKEGITMMYVYNEIHLYK